MTGTVSCLWFRQWGEARRTGDRAAAAEAEKAMATSKHWPILREMAKEGAYPETVWELASGDAERALGMEWSPPSAAAPRGRPGLRPLGHPGPATEAAAPARTPGAIEPMKRDQLCA